MFYNSSEKCSGIKSLNHFKISKPWFRWFHFNKTYHFFLFSLWVQSFNLLIVRYLAYILFQCNILTNPIKIINGYLKGMSCNNGLKVLEHGHTDYNNISACLTQIASYKLLKHAALIIINVHLFKIWKYNWNPRNWWCCIVRYIRCST